MAGHAHTYRVKTRHSEVVWQDSPLRETGGEFVGDLPETILPLVIDRLRVLNANPNTKSREISLAITHCEEAQHWLMARPNRALEL